MTRNFTKIYLTLAAVMLLLTEVRAQSKPESTLQEQEAKQMQRLSYLMDMNKAITFHIESKTIKGKKTEADQIVADRISPTLSWKTLNEEGEKTYQWLHKAGVSAAASMVQAQAAKTPEARKAWLDDAKAKEDSFERMVEAFVGPITTQDERTSKGSNQTRPTSPANVYERIKRVEKAVKEVDQTVKKYVEAKGQETMNKQITDLVWGQSATSSVKDLNKRQQQLSEILEQINETMQKVKNSKNEAEADFLFKVAELQEQKADALFKSIVEDKTVLPKKPRLKPMTGFSSGFLFQMQLHDEVIKQRVVATDPERIRAKAVKDYGDGRAGAGGISLHKAAEMKTEINMNDIDGAVVDKEQLILLYQGKKISFPTLNPEYLALAIRCIYGNEGVIKGEFISNEANAIVLQTGKDQFGEVVWKKEFLAQPWVDVPIGQTVTISVGPGIGILYQVEPSMKRVSYYGPLKNTKMGQVLLGADQLISSFLYGIDPKTGLPLSASEVPGSMTYLERAGKRSLAPQKEKKSPSPSKAKKESGWWSQGTWLVWVPDEFSLKLSEADNTFKFVDTRMKLSVWSVDEENVNVDMQDLADHSTRHYQELAETFPVLKELEEVAKAVSIVRWLKKNNVSLDTSWTKELDIENRPTPASIRAFTVFTLRDKSGKPWIETKKELNQ